MLSKGNNGERRAMRGGGAVEEGLRGRGRRGESSSRDSQAAAVIFSFLSVSEHGAAVGPLIINLL